MFFTILPNIMRRNVQETTLLFKKHDVKTDRDRGIECKGRKEEREEGEIKIATDRQTDR